MGSCHAQISVDAEEQDRIRYFCYQGKTMAVLRVLDQWSSSIGSSCPGVVQALTRTLLTMGIRGTTDLVSRRIGHYTRETGNDERTTPVIVSSRRERR